MQHHHDLIKVTCSEIGNVLLGYVETIQLILGVTDKMVYLDIKSTENDPNWLINKVDSATSDRFPSCSSLLLY